MSGQGYEQLTLFQEASPASRFPALGSEKEQGTTVTSGQKCFELLRSSSPLGLLAKMLLVSSVWQSKMVNLTWKTERLTASRVKTTIKEYTHSAKECYSVVSCKISVASDTPSSHLLFRLAASARTTGGNESLLSPTSVATDAEQGTVKLFPTPRAKECGDYQYSNGNHEKRTLTLSGAVKMFPTPTAFDWNTPVKSRSQQGSATYRHNLREFAKMYPTPQASDYRSPNKNPGNQGNSKIPPQSAHSLPTIVAAMYPTPTTGAGLCGGTGNYQQLQRLKDSGAITEDERRNMSQGNGGQLNPTWVEWLMGFPLGWTDTDLICASPEKISGWWDVEPDVPRVEIGVKDRVNRLKCLGNAVVPYQAYPILQAIFDIETQII